MVTSNIQSFFFLHLSYMLNKKYHKVFSYQKPKDYAVFLGKKMRFPYKGNEGGPPPKGFSFTQIIKLFTFVTFVADSQKTSYRMSPFTAPDMRSNLNVHTPETSYSFFIFSGGVQSQSKTKIIYINMK